MKKLIKRNMDRESAERERLYECLHEAGHVIAARAYGFRVAWVSIDQNFISAQGANKRGALEIFGPMSMALCVHLINPILARRKMDGPDDERLVRGYCIQVLAGPVAEGHYNPDFDRAVAAVDLQQVTHVCERIFGERSERRAFRQRVGKEATAFVEAHKGVIFHFAVALYNRETILEVDIDQAIATARAQALLGAV
ncbi:hypothetical protein G5V57_23445 [Nordella sp. HKS 07]|uniref:hypothetical protein n=1 Tax=Nordella sp. HKS 07 TaxID=2712222 RepID=UPI0013E1A2C8|nr:hypothetical protein [Nordella sp. HKS 07]QIG50425.1 hypothetical protein G5V57_23445 [Nordella sp. HKS 07]